MVSHKYGEKILLTAFNGISWLRRRKRSNLKGEMETKKIYVSVCVCMLHKTNAKLERRENGFEAFMLSLLQTHTKHNKEIHRFIDFVVVRYEQSRALVSLSLCVFEHKCDVRYDVRWYTCDCFDLFPHAHHIQT